MEDTHVHALDYLNVFRRRKWWLITPVAASIVVGAILVQVLPKEYHSDATLAVADDGAVLLTAEGPAFAVWLLPGVAAPEAFPADATDEVSRGVVDADDETPAQQVRGE